MSNRVIPKGAFNPNATTAPGVVVLESIAPGTISGIPTNIVGKVGTATWGPVNARINVSTPQDYAYNFGSVQTTKYDLGTAVNAALLQGTTGVYACVRVTDGTDTTASTKLLDTQAVPDVGAYLTALYSGTTGNTIQATITAASMAGTFNLAIGRPGNPAEIFSNISGSGAAFWANLVSAVNEGQSGVRGPSQLVMASLGTGVNTVTMTAEGANYATPPAVAFTGGGGTGAAGTAVLGFAIASVTVNTPGSFATIPTVGASVGTGAVLAPTMKLESATLASAGATYAVNDVLTVTGGTFTTAAQITVNTVDGSGHILTFTITNPGSYTVLPASPLTVTGGGGFGAAFNPLWGVLSIAVSAGGKDYDATSGVTFTGGGGTGGATATITLAATGGVKGVNMTAHGTGYSGTVNVGFSGGGGTGAAGTVSVGSVLAPAIPTNPYTFTGGTDGTAGVTGATLVGADTSPPTGMYVLRNSGMTAFALVDDDDSTTYANQDAFAAVTGANSLLVGPLGQTPTQAVSIKNSTGINDTTSIYLLGDYIYWLDTNNGGIERLISPQGFYAGLLANLSPEQSPLNKQIFGVLATQKTRESQNYSDNDYVLMRQNGIEVISNPIAAGGLFGCELGVNAAPDISINPVPIQRMLNFLSYSLSGAGVLGNIIGKLQTPEVQDEARAALNGFLGTLEDNRQIQRFDVILNDDNNPAQRVALGFMQANVNVTLFSVIYVFLIDLTVGTATLVGTA